MINTKTERFDLLNFNCGADFVNSKVKLPSEMNSACPEKAACLDGDGDRLIYFKRTEKKPLVINCDKLYAFLMMYIMEKLEMMGINSVVPVALVNTAY